MRSKNARPKGYKDRQWLGSDYAVRTMRWGGVIVLIFVVFHLAHLTIGADVPGSSGVKHCDYVAGEFTCYVYDNMLWANVASCPKPLLAMPVLPLLGPPWSNNVQAS